MDIGIISAEIDFIDSYKTAELERKRKQLEDELGRFTNKADITDYMVAVGSGIICGIIDSVFVPDFSLKRANEIGDEKANELVLKAAKKFGDYDKDGKDVAAAVKHLEDKFPIAADKHTNDFGGGRQHHLRDFSHHPTLIGLIFSILTQFTNKVYGTDTAGVFRVYNVSDKTCIGKTFPQKILFGAVFWFFHMLSDIAGSSGSIAKGSAGTGLPGFIGSLLKEASALPFFKSTNEKGYKEFSVWVSKLFNGTLLGERDSHGRIIDPQKFDLRTETGVAAEISEQAVPVVINECIVRGFYFIRRFINEVKNSGITKLSDLENMNISEFLPVNNRTIHRMLSISNATFTAFDMTDAAVRAAVESHGNMAMAAVGFLKRVNYVGAARLAVSVVQEIKDENKERELLRQKRIVTEELRDELVHQLEAYRHKLEDMVNRYLAEDIEQYLLNLDKMSKAEMNCDTDSFIYGTVMITKMFGREVQFTNQNEFDELMMSDTALNL